MGGLIRFCVDPPPDAGQKIRDLAAQIMTLEQFDQVVGDVEGPDALRTAVRDMLLPLVPQSVFDAYQGREAVTLQ